MVLGGEDQREVVDPLEAPDRTRQDDDPAEGPSESLGLEHDDVARRVLDQVVDVAPEDAAIPFDPLAPPSHDEEVHRLLADRVQDDLVDLVADLDDRAGVDPEVLADPSESLKPANPVVHVPEPNRLWREVSRDFDDMKEAELRVLGADDACAEFDEGLVLELPEREEDAVPLELHVVLRRRQDVAHLRGRVGRSRTARGSAASNPMIREPDREPD